MVAKEASAPHYRPRDLLPPSRWDADLMLLALVTGGRWCRGKRALSLVGVEILQFAEVLHV